MLARAGQTASPNWLIFFSEPTGFPEVLIGLRNKIFKNKFFVFKIYIFLLIYFSLYFSLVKIIPEIAFNSELKRFFFINCSRF